MAIKRKKHEDVGPDLPADFLQLTKRAFTLQTIAGEYEEAFKSDKAEIAKYLEETDEIDVELSVGLKTPEGLVCMKKRDNYKIDTDALAEMIKDGTISLETILSIATINPPKLKACLGEKKFNSIAEHSETEYLALTAAPEFKAQIAEGLDLSGLIASGAMIDTPAAPKTDVAAELAKAPAVKPSLSESIAKADAAAAKAKKFTKAKPASKAAATKAPESAETDLDKILNSI